MTNREILQKAIDKAITNGWGLKENFDNEEITVSDQIYKDSFSEAYLLRSASHNYHFELSSIIFSHSFAKAFWNEEPTDTGLLYKPISNLESDIFSYGEERILPAWQYHLQQMVLETNLIVYLEKFL